MRSAFPTGSQDTRGSRVVRLRCACGAHNRPNLANTVVGKPMAEAHEKARSAKTEALRALFRATLTGLEPATTGSTVRYSNQLSYSAILLEDPPVYGSPQAGARCIGKAAKTPPRTRLLREDSHPPLALQANPIGFHGRPLPGTSRTRLRPPVRRDLRPPLTPGEGELATGIHLCRAHFKTQSGDLVVDEVTSPFPCKTGLVALSATQKPVLRCPLDTTPEGCQAAQTTCQEGPCKSSLFLRPARGTGICPSGRLF